MAPKVLPPTGWKLPTGTTSGQFYALDTAMATAATNGNPVYNINAKQNYQDVSSTNKSNPFQGVHSGDYLGSLYSQGSSGCGLYWSSTAYSADAVWDLYFAFGGVEPGTFGTGTSDSFALRAVL